MILISLFLINVCMGWLRLCFFQSYIYFNVWRRLSTKELMCLNCGVREDSWESLGLQEIKPVNPEGNQSWIFIGRTDAEAETPILWPPDAKNWLLGKDPDAGKDRRQGGKGTTENEMFGWHHWLNGHEFEQALRDGEGQGSLKCCSPWGCKVWHDLNNQYF